MVATPNGFVAVTGFLARRQKMSMEISHEGSLGILFQVEDSRGSDVIKLLTPDVFATTQAVGMEPVKVTLLPPLCFHNTSVTGLYEQARQI